ncbi:MAG: hypothetical protein IKD03_01550, partial [Clostridia bacterium]|nr:hypothetical protein [Clostridia bacterium]
VTVTSTATNATVELEKDSYKYADTVNFTVTADKGYNVTGVTVNGEEVTEYTFTANDTAFEIVVTTRTYYIESNEFFDIKDERAVRSLKGGNGTITYVDADAILADDTLPALPSGENAYVKVTGKANDGYSFFMFYAKPMSGVEEFVNADYVEFQIYLTQPSRQLYLYNKNLITLNAGWNTVRLPIGLFAHTASTAKPFTKAEDWYNDMVNGGEFFRIRWGNATEDESYYLTSVRYGKFEQDATVGYSYVKAVDSTNVYSNGTQETTTYDGKNVVKITGGVWCNIYAKPVKTPAELAEYKYVVVKLYIDGSNAIEFYSQSTLSGATGNDFVSYGTYQPNKWVEVLIPTERVITLYPEYYLNINALFIVRNRAFNAIYVESVKLADDMTGVALADEVLREGEVTLNYTNVNNIEGVTLSVTDANGNEVELTNNTFTATAGEYTVTFSADGYVSVSETFTVYPVFNATIADPTVSGLTVTTGAITLTDPATDGALEGATVTVTAKYGEQDITVTDGKFTAPYYGATYNVIYIVSYNDKDYAYEKTVYIARPEAEENEVLSFIAPCDLEKVAMGLNNITYTKEWLAEFEGETGVVKFNFSGGDWPYMGFGTNQDM